jgi:hypothetical protein
MKRSPAVAIALILFLIVMYFGAYLLMRTDRRQDHMVILKQTPSGEMFVVLAEDYRFGGKYARTFFKPVNRVDRMLRPHRWLPD